MTENERAARQKKISHVIMWIVLLLLFFCFIFPFIMVVVNVFKQKNALGNNAMGLGFAKAIDIKSDIDAFLSIFSISETSEEIYFK